MFDLIIIMIVVIVDLLILFHNLILVDIECQLPIHLNFDSIKVRFVSQLLRSLYH